MTGTGDGRLPSAHRHAGSVLGGPAAGKRACFRPQGAGPSRRPVRRRPQPWWRPALTLRSFFCFFARRSAWTWTARSRCWASTWARTGARCGPWMRSRPWWMPSSARVCVPSAHTHTPPTDARARAHLPRRRVDRALCVPAHVQLVGVMGYEVRAAPRLRNALASSYFARARPGGARSRAQAQISGVQNTNPFEPAFMMAAVRAIQVRVEPG